MAFIILFIDILVVMTGKVLNKNNGQHDQLTTNPNEIFLNPEDENSSLEILKPFLNMVVNPKRETYSLTYTLTSPVALGDLSCDIPKEESQTNFMQKETNVALDELRFGEALKKNQGPSEILLKEENGLTILKPCRRINVLSDFVLKKGRSSSDTSPLTSKIVSEDYPKPIIEYPEMKEVKETISMREENIEGALNLKESNVALNDFADKTKNIAFNGTSKPMSENMVEDTALQEFADINSLPLDDLPFCDIPKEESQNFMQQGNIGASLNQKETNVALDGLRFGEALKKNQGPTPMSENEEEENFAPMDTDINSLPLLEDLRYNDKIMIMECNDISEEEATGTTSIGNLKYGNEGTISDEEAGEEFQSLQIEDSYNVPSENSPEQRSNNRNVEDNVESDPDFNSSEMDYSSDEEGININNVEANITNNNERPHSRKNVLARNINRNSGQRYTTAIGKPVKAREVKPLKENCRNNCSKILDENVRKQLFKKYWGLKSHDKRVEFIANLIDEKKTKSAKKKVKGKAKRNRKYTLIYNFEINGKRVQICKICFLATLDETESMALMTVKNKRQSSSGVTHKDRRGTHTPQNKIDEVIRHIKTFPKYESLYSMHTKKYLSSNLNLNKMYQLYCEIIKEPLSKRKYGKELHKLDLIFKKKNNNSCSKCKDLLTKARYSKIKKEKKRKIEQARKEHLACAASALKAKDGDKKKDSDSTHITCAFNMQQVLRTPHLPSDEVIFLRQLDTYNLTVHNCSSGESNHFMWPECTAGCGANEIASCLYRHIMLNIADGVKTAVFYSNTCGGQNKNSIVCSMFQYVIQKHPSLEVIDHKFLVPGHTQLECDKDMLVIETAKKKFNSNIHVPKDWCKLFRIARRKNKLKVDFMKQELFFSFSDLISKGLIQAKNKSFDLRKVCWLRYTKEKALVMFKCSLNEEEPFKEISFFKKGQLLNKLVKHQLPCLYKGQRPISSKKKEDLLKIVQVCRLLDEDEKYYRNLPVDEKIEKDIDPDLDRYVSDEDDN